MSEDKNQEKKPPRESLEEFCKRLGIKHNTRQRQGGVEFSPYHGHHVTKKPEPEQTTGTHKKPEAELSPEEKKVIDLVELAKGRKLTPQEVYNSLEQARHLGDL